MRRARSLPMALALCGAGSIACHAAPGDTGGSTEASQTAGTEATSPSSAGSASDGSGGTVSSSTMSATADASESGASTSGPDTGFPDVPPFVPTSCALEDLDPSADPVLAIDAGESVGQIPTPVAEALLRNCGCHYTDNVNGLIDYTFDNPQPLSSWQDFQDDFLGVLPADFMDRPTYEAVERRVVHADPLPMPPFPCGVEGLPPGTSMTDADRMLFADWLSAGAPDGASYDPP